MEPRRSLLTFALLVLMIGAPACAATDRDNANSAAQSQKMVVVGTVADVSASARLVVLTEAVQGIHVVVLSSDSQLLSAGGQPMPLQELAPGTQIQASGRPGGSEGLLATELRVVDPNQPAAVLLTPLPVVSDGIAIELPYSGASIVSPVRVSGRLDTVAARHALQARVHDGHGQVIGEMVLAVSGEAGAPGAFVGHIPFATAAGGSGTISVVETDGDGAVVASARVDVLLPGVRSSEVRTVAQSIIAE